MIKRILIIIAIVIALVGTASAGPPSPIQNQVITEIQNDLTAKAFEVSVYGTFAPKLEGNGRYGAGVELSHPITQYGFVGVRFDVLGQAYTAGTFGAGLKAPFIIAGHKVTPFAGTGLKSVLQGDPTRTGTVSASVFTGFQADLYHNKTGTVEVGIMAAMEYDSAYAGIQIFHGGPYASIKF